MDGDESLKQSNLVYAFDVLSTQREVLREALLSRIAEVSADLHDEAGQREELQEERARLIQLAKQYGFGSTAEAQAPAAKDPVVESNVKKEAVALP